MRYLSTLTLLICLFSTQVIAHRGNDYIIRAMMQVEKRLVQCQMVFSQKLLQLILPSIDATQNNLSSPNRSALEELLRQNSLQINSIEVQPILDNVEFSDTDVRLFWHYPVADDIVQLQIQWHLYPISFLSADSVKKLINANIAHNEWLQSLRARNETLVSDHLYLSAIPIIFKPLHQDPVELVIKQDSPTFRYQNKSGHTVVELQVSADRITILPLPMITLSGLLLMILILWRIRRIERQLPVAIAAFVIISVLLSLYNIVLFNVELPWTRTLYLPKETEARRIFRTLHQNLYRAFDYSDKSDIYDTLEQSVAGDLLVEMYQQVYGKLLVRNEEGKSCLIRSIVMEEAQITMGNPDLQEFYVKCRWYVEGLIIHSGHTHIRTNEYAALYTVGNVDGAWKLTAAKVIHQIRREGE